MNSENSKPTVLIVDDTPENIDVLTEILNKDYKVKAVRRGEGALKIAQSNNPPDLILLDIMMPEMDGFEVCRVLKLNDLTKKIPIIFITSKSEIDDETKGFELGAVDYITKPIKPQVVTARVNTHIKLKQTEAKLENQNEILEEKVKIKTALLEESLEKVKKASIETIYRLAKAAEYRDDDTGAHILRMSNYSAVIALAFGESRESAEKLLYSAQMHDLGKIGIPDSILLKPGKLNDREWSIMKQHPEIGAKILSNSGADVIELGKIISYNHHEKWDGTGYPRGLKGKNIPLEGRITAVADVFDALLSKRPYKEPYSTEKSLDIIKSGSGSHFDPEIVEAFFSVKDEILTIKDKYLDTCESNIFAFNKILNEAQRG